MASRSSRRSAAEKRAAAAGKRSARAAGAVAVGGATASAPDTADVAGAVAVAVAVRRIACAGFLAGVALSPRLWLSAREFPLAPPLAFVPAAPFPLDPVILGVFCAALAAVAWSARREAWIVACAAGAMLALQDQNRWQPWAYQYTAMLAALALLAPREPARALNACRAIVAGIYFWSGLQKLNASFLERGLAMMLDAGTLAPALETFLVRTSIAVPLAESAIGLGLLWPRTRRAASYAAVAMHAAILLLIGPFGRDWNSVVWPWNLAMIALVVVLFVRRTSPGPREILAGPFALSGFSAPASASRSSGSARSTSASPSPVSSSSTVTWGRATHAIIIVAFWMLPALSFAGLWDAYLSAALYSQNIRQAALKISPAAAQRMPEAVRRRIDADSLLWLLDWSLDEMNAPIYPEKRVFEAAARELCRHGRGEDDLFLIVTTRPSAWTGERDTHSSRCSDLR